VASISSETENLPSGPCVLIVNVHSTKNAGDAALLEMNIRQILTVWENARILISANYPEEKNLYRFPGVTVVPSVFSIVRKNRSSSVLKQILQLLVGVVRTVLLKIQIGKRKSHIQGGWDDFLTALQGADLVVAVSGNQFLSMGKYGWPFPITAFPIWAALFLKKPLYIMPQSIGPFKRGWERWIFRQLYSRARLVFLRDQVSLELAHKLHLNPERFMFSPDPAFALPGAIRQEAEQILSCYQYHADEPSIGITVITLMTRALDPKTIQQYYKDLLSGLLYLVQQTGAKVYIFNQVTGPTSMEDDRKAGSVLLDLLPEGQKNFIMVDEELSPAQLKACYGCMDLVIASRLHSGIFAMGAGVATLTIGYFTKTRGLMQSMGLDDWFIEIGKDSTDEIQKKLTSAWNNRDQLAGLIQKKANQYASEVFLVGDKIRKNYEQFRS
jgi:colanic acid/amylovoran biosynthesis protein